MKVVGATVLLALACAGCGGPYGDLESAFPSQSDAPALSLLAGPLQLSSSRHNGAFWYRGELGIALTAGTMSLRPVAPMNLLLDRIDIPAEAVSLCSRSASPDASASTQILVVDKTGTTITLPGSRELSEWCRENRIPESEPARKARGTA